MNLKPVKTNRQTGVVSLLTAVIVALLLVIVTTSALQLTSGELRQASDYDQSVKAYFAAESGVYDAINHIRQKLESGATLSSLDSPQARGCDPYDANKAQLDGSNGTFEYTCQRVKIGGSIVKNHLNPEQTAQYLFTHNDLAKITLSWETSDQRVADLAANDNGKFPSGDNWAGPGAVEVSIIRYPDLVSFNRDSIEKNATVARPRVNTQINATATDRGLRFGACNNSSQTYKCEIEYSEFKGGTYDYIVRLHARYNDVPFQLELLDGSGNPVEGGNVITIDVTGRAGDVYRRLETQIPANVQADSLLDFSLLSNEDICKNFGVYEIQNRATSKTGCDSP